MNKISKELAEATNGERERKLIGKKINLRYGDNGGISFIADKIVPPTKSEKKFAPSLLFSIIHDKVVRSMVFKCTEVWV